MGPERCLLCGAVIPEGTQICPQCLEEHCQVNEAETVQELRDIAEVLKITANTDSNIQKSMEALLRIAAKLEGKRNGR